MKKVLLLAALTGVNVVSFSQISKFTKTNPTSVVSKSVKTKYTGNEAGMPTKPVLSTPGVLGINETKIGETYYDLQTNSSLCERLYNLGNGKFSATWTYSANAAGFPNRGTGYNFFDGTTWGPVPTSRIESTRTGWTNIGVTTSGKEINISHGTSTNTIIRNTRAVAGTGTWSQTSSTNLLPIELWPKMAIGGPDGESVHMIGLTAPSSFGGSLYKGMDGALLYARSLDGGDTWDTPIQLPGLDSSFYESIGGDAYQIEAKGDVVVVVVTELGSPVRMWKSIDNGQTWVMKKVLDNGIEKFVESQSLVDTAGSLRQTSGGSSAILIDNNNLVHIAFDQIGFANLDLTDGSVSIYMFANYGLGYWNENMSEGNSIIVANGYWDWNGDQDFPADIFDNLDNYRYGNMNQFAMMPSFSVDANNNIVLMYSALTEYTDFAGGYYRHTYGLMSPDAGCSWTMPWDLTAGSYGILGVNYIFRDLDGLDYILPTGFPVFDPDDHDFDECVFANASILADTAVYFIFNKDGVPGTSRDGSGNPTPSFNEIIYKHISMADFLSIPIWECHVYVKETKCNGSFPVLEASCGNSYLWSTSETTPSITVTTVGTYTVDVSTLCTTDTLGLINDSSITVTVTDVNPALDLPVVTNTFGNNAVCEGDGSITLLANGGTQYLWSNGATSSSITISTVAQSGDYYYQAIDACGNIFDSDTLTISIYPNVQSIINGTVNICGDSTTLTATTFTGASYFWSNGSVGTSTIAYDGDTITLIVSNSNCSDTSTVVITKLPPTVNALVTASGGIDEVCEGTGTITLNATGGSTYAWSSGQTTSNIVLTTSSESGYYYVTATDICGNTGISDSVMVTIFPVPAVPVITGDKPSLTFTCTTPGVTYQWYLNGNPVGTNSSTYTNTNWAQLVSNPVWVTYVDANGCESAPSNSIILISTNVQEFNTESLKVYPNPSNGLVFVEQYLSGITNISVRNIIGQQVIGMVAQSNVNTLDLSTFGDGLYFISITNGGKEATYKVIVK